MKNSFTISQDVDVSSSIDQISISSRLDDPQQKDDEKSNENQEGQNNVSPQESRFACGEKKIKFLKMTIFRVYNGLFVVDSWIRGAISSDAT